MNKYWLVYVDWDDAEMLTDEQIRDVYSEKKYREIKPTLTDENAFLKYTDVFPPREREVHGR